MTVSPYFFAEVDVEILELIGANRRAISGAIERSVGADEVVCGWDYQDFCVRSNQGAGVGWERVTDTMIVSDDMDLYGK